MINMTSPRHACTGTGLVLALTVLRILVPNTIHWVNEITKEHLQMLKIYYVDMPLVFGSQRVLNATVLFSHFDLYTYLTPLTSCTMSRIGGHVSILSTCRWKCL